MNMLQPWAFLLVLAFLAARGIDRPRLTPVDLAAIGTTLALAIVQRLMFDQVTLDEPIIAPFMLAIPMIAAIRGGLRDGLAAAFGSWLALVVIAMALPVHIAGEVPQEAFVLGTVFACLSAGAAAALKDRGIALAPAAGLLWLPFFLVRDGSLLRSPSVLAVVVLTLAWTQLGTLVFPRVQVAA